MGHEHRDWQATVIAVSVIVSGGAVFSAYLCRLPPGRLPGPHLVFAVAAAFFLLGIAFLLWKPGARVLLAAVSQLPLVWAVLLRYRHVILPVVVISLAGVAVAYLGFTRAASVGKSPIGSVSGSPRTYEHLRADWERGQQRLAYDYLNRNFRTSTAEAGKQEGPNRFWWRSESSGNETRSRPGE